MNEDEKVYRLIGYQINGCHNSVKITEYIIFLEYVPCICEHIELPTYEGNLPDSSKLAQRIIRQHHIASDHNNQESIARETPRDDPSPRILRLSLLEEPPKIATEVTKI